MKKLLLAAAAMSARFAAQPVYAAYFCEVRTYAPGLAAAKGSRSEALAIIKSWIPEAFIVNDENLQFGDDFFIEIESSSASKTRASFRTKDSAGKNHYVVYEIVFREDNTVANVTMQQNQFRPLGPVIFDCNEIKS